MTKARAQIDWRRLRDELARQAAAPRTSFEHDTERSAAILRERTARLALVPAGRERREVAHFLVFSCGGARFGLPLKALQEVVSLDGVARVPGAAPTVRGIMSWRGEFVTVFDARPLIGIAPDVQSPPTYAAVVRGAIPLVALAFDRAEGVGRFDDAALHGPGEWQSRAPDLFRGATPDAVALFDATRLVARLRQDLRAA